MRRKDWKYATILKINARCKEEDRLFDMFSRW
jgi:hypothetical protein